ncbi:sigma-54-dependent transcriptional regulator [Aeoliella mucimassa]|uniref:DNA-binding transcriptional regulator NtrC n=1 Tax=Aeoliella mucimassa TaxID=2527972 RepID=A0A518AGI7_9BACT|nr:sigma-54 dependent transcriptional regulator [Aeoliella mucimassa]QDU53832.1 Transcriptional regulatory protein ZraR [Aeoliella mucimassa]
MPSILIVDDEQSICWGIAKLARQIGCEVGTAASAEEGLKLAAESPYDLVVLDVRLPGMDGLTAFEQFRKTLGQVPIIIITAFGDIDTAVRAVRSGAFEYLVKPFDLASIRSAIQRALEYTPPAEVPAAEAVPSSPDKLIGQTPIMQELFKQIALVAATDTSVVLQGESGVGKEVVARAIHRHSIASDQPFVAVNIAALSPSLAESELFGHTAGAFTGASRARDGLLVQANGGTLFLDEVADIPLPLQVKLLRAVEEGEVLPVGADQPVQTRFRIIGASHQSLKQCVQSGTFRHDLYFRLAAFEITIPPLRERANDIPLLAQHFAARRPHAPQTFSDPAIVELRRRPWHGNVRELRNAVEHAQVVCRSGVITPEHLPTPHPALGDDTVTTADVQTQLAELLFRRAEELLNDPEATGNVHSLLLSEVERPLLLRAMNHYANEYAPAARALGLHRTTLKKKLDDYEVSES